ncbi:MAG TPA: hypothetical protein VMS56_15265 [Thermoanaerobaculia bacterium]|nr:hypothetical protein [Thermoanaerobaculia bacterium]
MTRKSSPAEMLRSEDEETRHEAFERVASEMSDELAREVLAIGSGDGHPDVRADAVIALGPIVEECGMDYVDGDDDEALDLMLAPPLSRETFATIVAKIRGLYDDSSQPTIVRRRALEVLVRDPQPWQKDAVRAHFRSGDRDWRLTAVFAMGYLDGFDRELLETLKNETGDLLFEAVRSAGERETPGAAPIIAALARSPDADEDARLAAIAALPMIDRRSAGLLEELAGSDDEEIAEAAQEALEELRMYSMGGEGSLYDGDDDV